MSRLLAAIALCAACAGVQQGFDTLPATDRDRFERCREPLLSRLCPDDEQCLAHARALYLAQPASERDRWLRAYGCALR